jgi:tetratricopeptide (TPR) repeat protein
MRVGRAQIAAVLLGVSMFAVSAEPQEKKQERKKFSAQDLKRLVENGDRLMKEGKVIEARKYYLAVFEQEPANAPVALKLARVSEGIQDWDGALAAYQAVAANAQGPEKAEGHAGLANVHVKRGQFRDAADQARQAIALNPALASAHVSLAYSLTRLGSIQDALPAARKATEVAPTSALAHATLGEALLREGKVAEAEGTFRRALELDAKSGDAHAGLAEIQYRKGDNAGAVTSASTAIEINPTLPRAYSVRGRANHARGQSFLAQSDLTTAVSVDPNDVEAHFLLAEIQRSGNPGLAANAYRKVVALDPTRGEAYLALGEILVSQGDHAGAREPLEKAAERLPDSARANYLLGVVYEKQKDPERALQAYSRATELEPKLVAAHYAHAKLLRDHKKDNAAALASLEKAFELDPSNSDVLTDFGVALYDAKQGDRAGVVLEKAVTAPDYKNPLGFAVLGLVLKDKQNFADAVGWFEKASTLSPKWWLPHWGAAWSHFGLIKKGCPCGAEDDERVRKVKEHFDQMIALQGNDPALEQRVDALAKGQKIK